MEGGIPMAEDGGDQAKITPGDLTERFGRLTAVSYTHLTLPTKA
mgnify:CR=1 FL=1